MKKFNKNNIKICSSSGSEFYEKRFDNPFSIRECQPNSKSVISPWINSSMTSTNFNSDFEYNNKHEKITLVNQMERRFNKELSVRGLNPDFKGSEFLCKSDEQKLFSSILGKSSDDALNFLKNTDIDINVKDYWGNNVLIVMYLRSEIETLLHVLKDCSDNFSENALYDFLIYLVSTKYHSISENQQSEILKILLSVSDENILNKQDEFGNTVIMHSLENDFILQELLKNKCIDMSISNLCGNNPILYCVESNLEDSLSMIIDYMKNNYTKEKIENILNHKNFIMQSALTLATENNSIEIIKLLLRTNLIEINCQNYEGKTPLLYSIEREFDDITEILLNTKNININIGDNYGNTPIIKSIESGNHKLILSLLSKMANLDASDSIGRSPLLHALFLKYNRPKFISHDIPDIGPFDLSFASCCEYNNFTNEPSNFFNLNDCNNKRYTNNTQQNVFMKKNKIGTGLKGNSNLYDVIASKLIKSEYTNINVSDIQGQTPMTLICNNEDIFLFNMLLSDKKYNPHKENSKGISDYQYIKTKYESKACTLFGSEKYCPIKTCKIHGKFNKIKEEANIIKNVAKEISLKSDSDDLSIFDEINECENISIDEKFSDCDVKLEKQKIIDFNLDGSGFDVRNINDDNSFDMYNLNKSNIHAISPYYNNTYMPDIAPTHNFNNKILEPVKNVSEIEIKKFSVLKYFYEQIEKISEI